jgi:pimeloyl-ACP methyl ester carboxylesterase
VKFVKTNVLRIAYSDEGAHDAPVVVLLHGWPDDATTWHGVTPSLHRAGFRTIAPMHRGFGATRFLNHGTRRTGNAGVIAFDVIDLLNALDIKRAHLVGHDWGSTVAESIAVGWPKRVASLSMLATPSRIGGLKTPSFEQASRYWYQWFQTTKRGEAAIRNDPKGFARTMWEMWSPKGWFKDATFQVVSRSFTNPDWVDVTLHSYRTRWEEDVPDLRSRPLEAKVKKTQSINTPTIFLQGAVDGVTPPAASKDMGAKFTGPFKRIILPGVGHFPQREDPHSVARKIVAHLLAKAR